LTLPQFQVSVIPACPESFRNDFRRALLAGMTPKNKHSNNEDALRTLPQGVFIKTPE
jgi:hypothetical protein